MKVFFAPDTSDHPNWGCRVMGAWFPRALARTGATVVGRTGSRWFMQRFADFPELDTFADIRCVADAVRDGRLLPQLAARLQECDLVYLNGENFVRPGTRKGRRLLLFAYLARAVFGKPCILANHSVDLSEPALEVIVREVYPLLDAVHFREQRSVDQAASFVSPGRWRLVPDVAWAMPATPMAAWGPKAFQPGYFCAATGPAFDPRKPYVTVCASSVFGLGRYKHVDAAPAFVDLCRRLNQEVAPVLLAAPDEPDLRIMRRVQAELGLPLLDLHMPVRRAIDAVGNAAVHIGGRWHPGIFAASGGTPLVAFGANTHKMHSLVESLALPGPVFDATDLAPHIDAVVALARSHVESGSVLRNRIRERARELGTQVTTCVELVRARSRGNGGGHAN